MCESEFCYLCPICNSDLSDLDEMWRSIHVNSCLAKIQNPERETRCPICNADISHLNEDLANRHINNCIDNNQRKIAKERPNERCPICGKCIRDLNERQRRIHDQTCKKSENVKVANVIHYPKVIESLPTPQEWELYERLPPKLEPTTTNDGPIFGKVIQTSSLQGIDGFNFCNLPFYLATPGV